MKFLFIAMFLTVISGLCHSQAVFIKKEFCKKSEVEIMTNCGIPENYVIVGTTTFEKVPGIDSLSDQTNAQKQKMRGFARKMKSCHILVDFSGELLPLTDGEGMPISNTQGAYFALQPSFNQSREED